MADQIYKLQYNGRTLTYPGWNGYVAYEPPLPYPSDMDFIYLANDFDGSKIPNIITTSDMGPYMKAGTITKNGSGSSCYLSSSKSPSDDLYINLTSDRLNAMKAESGTYTFFFRVINTTSGLGGIFTWRNGDANYIYMIRSNGNQFQIHFSSGTDLGTTNFSLATDNVYKVSVSGNNYTAKNLTSGYTWTTTNTSTKAMGTRMHTFWAGDGSETSLDRFYACAGIARATTDEEDVKIKNILMNQSTDPTPPEPEPWDPVQIGNQIWSSKNLAIDDGGEGITTVTVNYGKGDVVEYHYTWDAAVRVASSVQGWHLPTRDEFSTLASYVGSSPGTKLKSIYGWEHNYYYGNGTDEFHFTGLPAGDYYEGTYYRFGKNARFWSSSSLTNGIAYYQVLAYDDDYFSDGSGEKTNGCSVRLIKDS